jgi:hypothetical protein
MSLVHSALNSISITHQVLKERSSSLNLSVEPAAPPKVTPLEARVSQAPGQEVSTAAVGAQTQMIAQSTDQEATVIMLEGARPIASEFEKWYSEVLERSRDIMSDGAYEQMLLENKTRYIGILERAETAGASHDPKGFLKTLNGDDLAVLERVNGQDKPIAIDSLSHEAASNLLTLPGKQTDTDRDGYISTGNNATFAFPPTDAPQSVVNAWDKATKGMKWKDVLTMQLNMWVQANGIDQRPGGATARYYANDFNWTDFASNLVANARDSRAYQTTELQRQVGERLLKGYMAFLDALQS